MLSGSGRIREYKPQETMPRLAGCQCPDHALAHLWLHDVHCAYQESSDGFQLNLHLPSDLSPYQTWPAKYWNAPLSVKWNFHVPLREHSLCCNLGYRHLKPLILKGPTKPLSPKKKPGVLFLSRSVGAPKGVIILGGVNDPLIPFEVRV